MAGFGNNRVATGVHDDLYSRCLALSVTGSQPVVLCGVDSIGLFTDDVERIRTEVRKRSAPREPNVVVASTHDHEAPDTMGLWGPAQGRSGINEAYNEFVVERVARAAADADLPNAIGFNYRRLPSVVRRPRHDDPRDGT